MIQYNEIKQISQQLGLRDDPLGSFLSAVSSGRAEEFITAAYRFVLLGYVKKINPELNNLKDEELVNPLVIQKDLIKNVTQTMMLLNVIVRRADFLKIKEILEHCIELLFDVGMRYDGTDLSGANQEEIKLELPKPNPTDVNNHTDLNMDSDLESFLRGLN